MPIGVHFKTIEPVRLRTSSMRTAFLNPLRDLMGQSLRLFKRTTATWEQQPVWEAERRFAENTPQFFVQTDDRLYFFLNNGTNIRYAIMTDPFSPKSQVRSLDSQQGVGGRSHMDFQDPAEGIAGRHWDDEVRKIIEPQFVERLTQAMGESARVSGHLYEGPSTRGPSFSGG